MPITEMLPGGSGGWRRWGFGAASLLVHAGLLAALVVSTDSDEDVPEEEEEEEVTFVDIRRFAPPPPPAASSAPAGEPDPTPSQPQTQPQPSPQQPRPQPQTPPRSTDIVEAVDSLPDPLGDTPPAPPAPTAPRIEQSTGGTGGATEGAEGGVAGGVEGGTEGGKVGGVVGGQGEEVPEEGGTFIASVVDRQAQLTNRRDLPRLMKRLYPNSLQSAGVGGRVVVQFVVGTNGRVDMSTVKILSSTNSAFEGPTREALSEFRFRPARVGDRNVRMLTQMPVVWEVQ